MNEESKESGHETWVVQWWLVENVQRGLRCKCGTDLMREITEEVWCILVRIILYRHGESTEIPVIITSVGRAAKFEMIILSRSKNQLKEYLSLSDENETAKNSCFAENGVSKKGERRMLSWIWNKKQKPKVEAATRPSRLEKSNPWRKYFKYITPYLLSIWDWQRLSKMAK